MALDQTEQLKKLIDASHHILITFKKQWNVDAVASALALALVLRKANKVVDVVCDGFVVPPALKFLPGAETIATNVSNVQKFVISVDVSGDRVDEFSYTVDSDRLKIFITAKSGGFSANDVTSENSSYKYDLIITLNTPDLDSLGDIYQKSTEFFYNTTIINIDHSPDNEQYGQLNITDLNAVASGEIIFGLVTALDPNGLDTSIATCLLTGIIAETKSFKTPTVTPKTLSIAGQLMTNGGDRETIIRNLYRNRSLTTLKLWGRLLARLKTDDQTKIVWSLLAEHDFIEAQASPAHLPEVIDELISFIPDLAVAVLIYQHNGAITVRVQTFKNLNALYLTKEYKPIGSKELVEFTIIGKTLLETEQTILDSIKKNLGVKKTT